MLEDCPYVQAIVEDLLQKAEDGEYKIRADLRIFTADGEARGDIRHHILAVRNGIPIDILRHAKIKEGSRELIEGAHDWRICNMNCDAWADIICGLYHGRTTSFDDDTLYFFDGDVAALVDRSEEMSLIFAAYDRHTESRDHRTVIMLGNGIKISLARFVVAAHIYGYIPTGREGISKLMQRFNEEYAGKEVG